SSCRPPAPGAPAARCYATAFLDIPTALPAPSGNRREDAPPDRPLLVRKRRRSRLRMRQIGESRRSSLRRLRSSHLTIQPFLRRREAIESGDGRREIARLRCRVKARSLQLVAPGKKVTDETRKEL